MERDRQRETGREGKTDGRERDRQAERYFKMKAVHSMFTTCLQNVCLHDVYVYRMFRLTDVSSNFIQTLNWTVGQHNDRLSAVLINQVLIHH